MGGIRNRAKPKATERTIRRCSKKSAVLLNADCKHEVLHCQSANADCGPNAIPKRSVGILFTHFYNVRNTRKERIYTLRIKVLSAFV